MLRDVDVESLEKKPFDGATILGSKYIPPMIPNYMGEVQEGLKVYNGNCHCGAVTYTVKSKPLEELEVLSCNCSSCSRVRLVPILSILLLTSTLEGRFMDLPTSHGGATARR
jgi:hypothetical protein